MKTKLKPSWEIYSRILWDDQFNERLFFIGYQDRVSESGVREKPLIEWNSTDIPWNRVLYIKCKTTVVWDRESRLDLFESRELPKEAFQIKTVELSSNFASDFNQKTTFQFKNNKWTYCVAALKSVKADKLKIATYNVLSDEYKQSFVQSEDRLKEIVKVLKARHADILVLQEVTPSLLQLLMTEPWIQKQYLSDVPNRAHFHTHRTVIISQFYFSLQAWDYSKTKQFLVAGFLFNERPFLLAGLHLSSNRAENSKVIRGKQLTTIVRYLENSGSSYALAGDFNMRGDEGLSLLSEKNIEDVWTNLRSEEGYTFEPDSNKLAGHFSLSGLPARFDRILYYSKDWFPQSIQLFGQQSLLSDHYGVEAEFELKKAQQGRRKNLLQRIPPTYQSAIVVIPPKPLWPQIQKIRGEYDSKVDRWMPHITLIYGFVPDDNFEIAAKMASRALMTLKPFDVLLSGYGFFMHRNNCNAWVKPESELLIVLQKLLQTVFPHCDEQSSRGGYTPHLTIGQFPGKKEAELILPEWKTDSFDLTRVAFISREKETPFKTICSVELGSGKVRFTDKGRDLDFQLRAFIANDSLISESRKEQQKFSLEIVEDACSKVLGNPVSLIQIGSSKLKTASYKSDIDVVCLIPRGMTKQSFFKALKEELMDWTDSLRLVDDALVPILKVNVDSTEIDVLCAQYSAFPAGISQISMTDKHMFDEVSWKAVSGYFEAENILESIRGKVSVRLFRELVSVIKLWAEVYQLKGNSSGFPGSFTWTLIAAKVCQDNKGEKRLFTLVKAFFNLIATFDWSSPLAIDPNGRTYKVRFPQDRMPVITTVSPVFNSCKNVTASTFSTVLEEAKKALRLLEKPTIDWTMFFTPPEYERNLLYFKLSGSVDQLSKGYGWLEGNLVGLIVGLEQRGIRVRPYPGNTTIANQLKVTMGIKSDVINSEGQKLLIEFAEQFLQENTSSIRVVFNQTEIFDQRSE